jgi:hypothetical protein
VFVLDVFTRIGALLGFISTIILVYDRLVRYRPVASIEAVRDKATMSMPGQIPPILHIRNVAPFHLLVERFVVEPSYFRIMPNLFPVTGNRSLVTYGSGTPILLAPNEERDMAMVASGGRAIAKTERIKLTIPSSISFDLTMVSVSDCNIFAMLSTSLP